MTLQSTVSDRGAAREKMRVMATDPFDSWFAAVERRHMADLTFQEVRRGVQALSSLYVERRGKAPAKAALDGAGKRAAFAMFYGAIHFLLIRNVTREIGAAKPAPGRIIDLGCGTGVAGAAWATEAGRRPVIAGHDRNPWATREAGWTYRELGLRGRARCGDLMTAPLPGLDDAVIAAFAVNELDREANPRLLQKLLEAAGRGARVLVVEPIARRMVAWWDGWAEAFTDRGGRDDTWRFAAELPESVRLMDRAAGLDHRELTGRSLYLDGRTGARRS